MNQDLLLNADNINPTLNNGGKKYAVNNQLDTRNKGPQDFSSELDKHIEKQDSAGKAATSDTKQSDIKVSDQHQHKAEESENKNGNTLPDEQLAAEEAEQNIEKSVIVDDGVELDVQLIEGTQSLSQNPAAASQLKGGGDNNPNVTVTDVNKNLEKLVSADVATKQDTETLNQNKQQPETSKIRPDILQALSARQVGKDGENNSVKNELKTLLTAEQLVDKKPPFKELQLSDLMKTMVPEKVPEKVPQASQLVDRSIANVLVNIPSASVTESGVKSAVPSLDIQPPVQSNAWNRVLTARVIWLAREGVQQATLKLNPANLGPVEVKLTMNDEKVHVTFVAQHAATRDALEQALPRLRESFIENGLEFADADVLQHDFEQADNDQTDKESVSTGETEQSVLSGGATDNEQQVVATEQDVEVGVSLYA